MVSRKLVRTPYCLWNTMNAEWSICNKIKQEREMKRDVGMACQKVHKQGRVKVMLNIQSLIHPNIFSQEQRCREGALYIYHHFYLSLFV